MKDIKEFVQENKDKLYSIHKELCLIPAPSHYEDERAAYCKRWLENIGAKGVYIDEAKNVVFPYCCEGSNAITIVNAHTDTVFPMETPLNFVDDGKFLRCPGVGDDTGSLAVMLFTIQYFLENNVKPKDGIVFVCNSCEEGLGNLKGIRQIYEDFQGRVKQHIAIDGSFREAVNRAVGSTRMEVTVLTEGGHSYGNFGNVNAIAEAAKIISKIYQLKVPKKKGTKTTYNVGTIKGGTSVNSIAQNVSFLCEYRSDDYEGQNIMKNAFDKIFKNAQNEKVKLEIKIVGERPCGIPVDENRKKALCDLYKDIIRNIFGKEPVVDCAGSTDCNIPLSIGIPSICIGAFDGDGEHTTEEWIDKDSMLDGLEVVTKYLLGAIQI